MPAYLYDINLWVALTFRFHPHHDLATAEFALADSLSPAVFCRATQQGFFRLITSPGLHKTYRNEPALTNAGAIQRWNVLQSMDEILWLDEPIGLEQEWKKLAGVSTASPKIWMDAYLAAFAKCSGSTLVTFDEDFTRFPGVPIKLLATLPP